MAQINPWINFNGNSEEALNFYKSVFGGDSLKVIRFQDSDKVMAIGLPIGQNILMANDVPESLGPVSENENRSKISVSTESRAEADKIFKGLSEDGSIEAEMSDSPWGTYFGMFRDKYGIEWIIDFDPKTIV
jgi:PhnB protein